MADGNFDNINSLAPVEIQQIINEKLAKFLSACNIPFMSVENEYFLDFVNALNVF